MNKEQLVTHIKFMLDFVRKKVFGIHVFRIMNNRYDQQIQVWLKW